MKIRVIILAVMAASSCVFAGSLPSPYAGQESSEIKALSPSEVTDLLQGKGMGLARAAELNGYPGPAHVLELAAELGLSPRQLHDTEALFKSMDLSAKRLGEQLVEEERRLDRMFRTRQVAPGSLSVALERIAGLQAGLRHAHLEAHLRQTAILTSEQIDRYFELRGYGEGVSSHGHHH